MHTHVLLTGGRGSPNLYSRGGLLVKVGAAALGRLVHRMGGQDLSKEGLPPPHAPSYLDTHTQAKTFIFSFAPNCFSNCSLGLRKNKSARCF